MDITKEVLKHCVNFYEIINFEPIEGDNITSKMINLYREYIFKIEVLNEDIVENLTNLDKAMKKYIDDYFFRKDMQHCILNAKISRDTKDIIKLLINKIIDFFLNYHSYTTRVIYISKWI